MLGLPPWELAKRPHLWAGGAAERLAQAAEYLGVKPLELADQPLYWREAALMTQSAEAYLEDEQQRAREFREKTKKAAP